MFGEFVIFKFSFHLENYLIALGLSSVYAFYFQVVNDLLNPAGQNLRIREDTQVIFSFDFLLGDVL